jgi:ankyrin repeat protein
VISGSGVSEFQFHESWTNNCDFLGSSNASPADFGFVESLEVPNPVTTRPSDNVDASGVSSTIHDAARITDWDRVLTLCSAHPEHAKYSGRDGWTALHHACNRRCPLPEVADALIRAYPGALLKEDEKGFLPLHYACRFKAPKDVVRLLLQMYPDKGRVSVSKRDRQGRTPLFYAVRYDAPAGVAGLLLEVDPSAVLEEDQSEESPLALVWDSWAEKLEGKRIINNFLPTGLSQMDNAAREEQAVILQARLKTEPKLYKRWLRVNMLLKAAFGFPVEDDSGEGSDEHQQEASGLERKWRILHAAAVVKCHLSLFLLACALHPEQARELDEGDLRRSGDQRLVEGVRSHQTALHLAASSNVGGEHGKTVIINLLNMYREAAELPDGVDGSLPLHRMVENERKQDWPTHAAILYHFFPRAVRIADRNGKLPLHRATSAMTHIEREDDGVQRSVIVQLVRSFPQAASHADRSGCLPLHMIAMHAEVWDDDVEAVYAAHTAAVQVRAGPSSDNRLALHMAASSPDSRESLIARLVELHPRGAALTDRQGKLPLHLACELGKEWDAGVSHIHEAFHEAAHQAEDNARGWMPLHMASTCPSASAELIAKLCELNPEAASVADTEGRFALHLACRSGKSWQGGLKSLFEANPSAVLTGDNAGLLPLHVAAFRCCVSETEADSESDATGDVPDTPSDAEQPAKLDVLYNLLRAEPSVLRVSTSFL